MIKTLLLTSPMVSTGSDLYKGNDSPTLGTRGPSLCETFITD